MPQVPIPSVFPGDFFVLSWDRDRETFLLELDDDAESSFDLGTDPARVVLLLRLRGFEKDFRETAVDYAREFGVAQCIPAQQRVIQIIPREAKQPALKFPDEEPENDWYPGL